MTLNDLFSVLSADRATLRVLMTPRLAADIPVDLNNAAMVADVVEAYGERTVDLVAVDDQPEGLIIELK